MKRNSLKYALAALPLLGFTACMDFDTPGDEFNPGNTPNVDVTVFKGNADSLDYSVTPPVDSVEAAVKTLEDYIGFIQTAEYYLLGGKDGATPAEHAYQMVYNMTTDQYCGYMTVVNSSFMQFNMETTYSYVRMPNEGPYGKFLSMKTNLANLLNMDASNKLVEVKAIALLLFNYAAQEMTDLYGSIPYVDHKGNKENNPFEFNKGIDIYASIIQNLDDINAVLENFKNRPQWYQDIVNQQIMRFDYMTQGKSVDDWRRMANSMKLRMAMHVVKVMPDKAKQWAEEAVAAGVVETIEQQTGIFPASGSFITHPLKVIFADWNDCRVNASFINMLKSLQHPYMEYMFAKNSNDLVNAATGEVLEADSEVIGVRAGLRMEGSQQYFSNMRYAFSRFNTAHDDFLYMPLYTIKAAEMHFLRAEGILRGWNMGGESVEYWYNKGIEMADCGDWSYPTNEYQSRVEDYMAVAEATPTDYVDPMDGANNIEGVTKIGVKWNDGDDLETKLEKIITQKYIALFPYSVEAWTELRRTGYPKIFPVLNPKLGNDGSLNDGDLIRRMRLPWGDTQAGTDDVNNTGIPALGGPDQFATRVFWDTESPNF